MKLLLIMLLFIISCTETNQKFSSNNKIELFNTSSEITIKDFKNHIGFLASDDLKGRASGTFGDEMAKDYIKKILRKCFFTHKKNS